MAKTPPPAVVSVTEVVRTGLDILERNLVPAPIAVMDLRSRRAASCSICRAWWAELLLYETVVGPRNSASLAKFLDLEMSVHAGGRERTVDEYRALFASPGLKLERVLATAGPMSIIEARAS